MTRLCGCCYMQCRIAPVWVVGMTACCLDIDGDTALFSGVVRGGYCGEEFVYGNSGIVGQDVDSGVGAGILCVVGIWL